MEIMEMALVFFPNCFCIFLSKEIPVSLQDVWNVWLILFCFFSWHHLREQLKTGIPGASQTANQRGLTMVNRLTFLQKRLFEIAINPFSGPFAAFKRFIIFSCLVTLSLAERVFTWGVR